MFGAEGKPGTIERVIRRSEDSNADPRTDEVARTGVVHVPAARQGGCNTPHGVLGGPADNTITRVTTKGNNIGSYGTFRKRYTFSSFFLTSKEPESKEPDAAAAPTSHFFALFTHRVGLLLGLGRWCACV